MNAAPAAASPSPPLAPPQVEPSRAVAPGPKPSRLYGIAAAGVSAVALFVLILVFAARNGSSARLAAAVPGPEATPVPSAPPAPPPVSVSPPEPSAAPVLSASAAPPEVAATAGTAAAEARDAGAPEPVRSRTAAPQKPGKKRPNFGY